MSLQGKTQQVRNKAKGNTTLVTRSVARSSSQTDLGDKDGTPQDNKNSESKPDNEIKMSAAQEKDLLEKMSDIMKVALAEALSDMKKLVASEISGLSLTHEESLNKVKTELTNKQKSLDGKIQKQKSALDKMPFIEQSIVKVNEVLTEELCDKIHEVSDIIPKVQQLDSKMDVQQDGLDEIGKSLEYTNEDVSSNKASIEKLENLIKDQQKSINKLINENRKIKKKISDLQDLTNTLDNRQRKFNLVFEGIAEVDSEKENEKETITKLLNEAKIQYEASHLDSAYRLGKNQQPGKDRS